MAIDYLISMTDFVIENENMINQTESEMSKDLFRLAQYAHFLKQKLEPWMFVPCKKVNDKWVFLEEPKNFLDYQDVYNSCEKDSNLHAWYNDCSQYENSKERVLFEGFEWNVAQFCDEPMIEINSEYGYLVYDYKDGTFQNENEVFFESIEDIIFKLKLTDAAKKRINT